ncbi:MAG: hypothetical protein ACI87W_003112, partial [Halieaceae bacterium]
MRPFRFPRQALLLIPALPLLLVAVLVFSQRLTLQGLQALVALTTPYELQLRDPQLQWLPFSFQSELLLIAYADATRPPLLSIQGLDIHAPLRQLLLGEVRDGTLKARNISYFLDETQADTQFSAESLLLPLQFFPAKADIESIHLMSRRNELWVFPLLNLSALRLPDDSLAAIASASVGEQTAVLELRARPSINAATGRAAIALDAALYGRDELSQLNLQGYVAAQGASLSYDLALQGQYKSVGEFVAALDEDAYPFAGNLRIDGRIAGGFDSFQLTVSDMQLDNLPSYLFSASGSVTQESGLSPALAIAAQGTAQKLQQLELLPPDITALFDSSKLVLELSGTLADPLLTSTTLSLTGPQGLSLRVVNDTSAIALTDLVAQQPSGAPVDLALWVEIEDFDSGLRTLNEDLPLEGRLSGRLAGRLRGNAQRLQIDLATIELSHSGFLSSGKAGLLWQDERLSAQALHLQIQSGDDGGIIDLQGAIADLQDLSGVELEVQLQSVGGDILGLIAPAGITSFANPQVSGSLRLNRALERINLGEINVEVRPVAGVSASVTGSAMLAGVQLEADLELTLTGADAAAMQDLSGFKSPLSDVHASLRLRPTYATLIANGRMGTTPIQAIATADLNDGALGSLGLDFYSSTVSLEDFARIPESVSAPTEEPPDAGFWKDRLPRFPLRLTLRADALRGPLSQIDNFVLAIDGQDRRYLLKQLDAHYAGGELIMRGVVDLGGQEAAISLAGQGIRVPLGALTEDLGVQKTVRGSLSLRGGLSTRGESKTELLAALQGRVALALTDTQVTGAAYDLLMSNLLAWLVTGAAQDKTTFDCTMAQFDISDGIARSDSLYVETPRMLATGKAQVDLSAATLDLRLQPRSKSRAFQFPSAVKIRGPLSSPRVSASPIQATADASAQALLLLPSLMLKLFGLGDSPDSLRPC